MAPDMSRETATTGRGGHDQQDPDALCSEENITALASADTPGAPRIAKEELDSAPKLALQTNLTAVSQSIVSLPNKPAITTDPISLVEAPVTITVNPPAVSISSASARSIPATVDHQTPPNSLLYTIPDCEKTFSLAPVPQAIFDEVMALHPRIDILQLVKANIDSDSYSDMDRGFYHAAIKELSKDAPLPPPNHNPEGSYFEDGTLKASALNLLHYCWREEREVQLGLFNRESVTAKERRLREEARVEREAAVQAKEKTAVATEKKNLEVVKKGQVGEARTVSGTREKKGKHVPIDSEQQKVPQKEDEPKSTTSKVQLKRPLAPEAAADSQQKEVLDRSLVTSSSSASMIQPSTPKRTKEVQPRQANATSNQPPAKRLRSGPDPLQADKSAKTPTKAPRNDKRNIKKRGGKARNLGAGGSQPKV
ncbi:hypothetical protein BJ508DRAFT_307542 [Ascobolus immersus RN42]|uniref:Uncharacterized protein n=1 Tax=Ascobolus immersus RN42 TaxID=1160509 RepID=A0A3N4I6M3_ASCIM|nr:hypothetical protein BJ508DRAFT_307542 [Ascobolus immersus RN42]